MVNLFEPVSDVFGVYLSSVHVTMLYMLLCPRLLFQVVAIDSMLKRTIDSFELAQRQQFHLKKLLNETRYNILERPPGIYENGSGPTHVNTFIDIVSIGSINDFLMEFKCQFMFIQEWFDTRLSFQDDQIKNDYFITLGRDQEVWKPDTFFQNEKSGHVHDIDQENSYIKLRKDGRIKYSKRMTMAFSCPMNLRLYPHDSQVCSIEFATYAYTVKDIEYFWNDPHMRVSPAIYLNKFDILDIRNDTCKSKTLTGTYSCLKIVVKLERQFSIYLVQCYIPSCMLVAVSCLSFWIDWRSAPARVPLAIVTLLTMTAQQSSINANLPPVSYVKAIDIWTNACISFIFSALIEYAVVNFLGATEERRRGKPKNSVASHDAVSVLQQTPGRSPAGQNRGAGSFVNMWPQAPHPPAIPGAENEIDQLITYPDGSVIRPRFRRNWSAITNDDEHNLYFEATPFNPLYQQQRIERRRRFHDLMRRFNIGPRFKQGTRADRLDQISRILFPLGFIGFNIAYWTNYL